MEGDEFLVGCTRGREEEVLGLGLERLEEVLVSNLAVAAVSIGLESIEELD